MRGGTPAEAKRLRRKVLYPSNPSVVASHRAAAPCGAANPHTWDQSGFAAKLNPINEFAVRGASYGWMS